MGDPASEKLIFNAFLRVAPDFAEESIASWEQPTADPPDVLCITKSGGKVGVELAAWLHEVQISSEKKREAREVSILDAIGPQPNNNTANIYNANLYAKLSRVVVGDQTAFRAELFDLIQWANLRWQTLPSHQSLQGYWHTDFSSYPTLVKYLSKIEFYPRDWYEGRPPDGKRVMHSWPNGNDWLGFRAPGGFFSEQDMLNALLRVLCKKIEKYKNKPPSFPMDEFNLLVHYDKAFIYNAPAETAHFKFEDAAQRAREFIGHSPGRFDKIFLFVGLIPGEKAFQLFPNP